MYINPFWAGVLATILIEAIGFVGFIIFINSKGKGE